MKKKERFSPGDWCACHDGNCSCKQIWCDDYPVAKVVSGKWGDDFPSIRLVGDSSLDLKAEAYIEQFTYGEVDEKTARANARLIARSPVMYRFIKSKALNGDKEAKKIVDEIQGE